MSRIRANQITNKGANGAPNFPNGLTATGIITATISNSTLGTLAVTGNATIDGNLGVGGTITYEDVARVDATGISTFREGFKVGPLSGIGLTAYKDGSIRSSGIITATTYYGSGSNLTGIDATQIVTGNTSVQTVDTGSDGHVKVTTEGSERLRIDNGGRLHIGATTGPSNSKLSVTGTDATNYITLKNTTASDSSGARKSIIVFQGTRSGGEVTDLVHIAGQHDGGSDNDWGAFRVLVNNGSGVTERFGIGQGGEVRVNAQIGSSGQVLQSAGSGSPAVWATASSGISIAQQYRLTSTLQANQDPLTGWELVDTQSGGGYGTSMSESSGIWTFPSTGFWLITFHLQAQSDNHTQRNIADIRTTTDNSTYSTAASAMQGIYDYNNSYPSHGSCTAQHLMDVQNTTTHKVKLTFGAGQGGEYAHGDSNYTYTYGLFERLGDT